MSVTARSIVRTLTATPGQEPLDDDRIAARDPFVQFACLLPALLAQSPRSGSLLDPRRDPLAQIPPHRDDRDANLASNRLLSHPALRECANRGHYLASDHRYLRVGDTRTSLSSSIRPSSGVRISVARGSISLSLYTVNAVLALASLIEKGEVTSRTSPTSP